MVKTLSRENLEHIAARIAEKAPQETTYTKDEVDELIDEEKEDRIAADDLLTIALKKEAEKRAEDDSKLDEKINEEIDRSIAKDTELQEAVELEITVRTDEDNKLKKLIEDAQTELDNKIEQEKVLRTTADEDLSNRINAEESARIDADKLLREALAEEAATRASEDVRVKDESKVTISEQAGTGDILKKYIFTQDGNEIGVINIAKDLVVEGGSIVEVEGIKYLRLIIANQADPVDIPVADLVDLYYGDNEYVIVKDDNTITLTTTAKNSLALADTAVQPDELAEVENELKELITVEKERAIAEETVLKSSIDEVKEAHNTDIAELKANDKVLESSILAEETARKATDDQLEANKLDKSEIGEWTIAELMEIFGGSGDDGELD